jgi:hypothetical protein
MIRRCSEVPLVFSQPWSALMLADSFYARLAEWRDVHVHDENYASLYKDSNEPCSSGW